MDENELVSGKLYWIKSKRYNQVCLAEYDSGWSMGGCFNLIGNDEIFHPHEFDILGLVELVVPEYAKETGYGN